MQVLGFIFIAILVVVLMPVLFELFIAVAVGIFAIMGGVLMVLAEVCIIVFVAVMTVLSVPLGMLSGIFTELEKHKELRRQILAGMAGVVVLLSIVLLAYFFRAR